LDGVFAVFWFLREPVSVAAGFGGRLCKANLVSHSCNFFRQFVIHLVLSFSICSSLALSAVIWSISCLALSRSCLALFAV